MDNNNNCCDICSAEFIPNKVSTGYGTDTEGRRICYSCIAKMETEALKALPIGGKYYMYLSGEVISNWPGSLKIRPYRKRVGRHNFARNRTDVWFRFEGGHFWGRQYGNFTDVLHITKIR